MLAAIEGELTELGELAGGELYQLQIADRLNEPVHTPWTRGATVSTASKYRRCGRKRSAWLQSGD